MIMIMGKIWNITGESMFYVCIERNIFWQHEMLLTYQNRKLAELEKNYYGMAIDLKHICIIFTIEYLCKRSCDFSLIPASPLLSSFPGP